MSELLSVRELTVEFPTDHGVARVLDRISLGIGPGEVVGLVGESGCGKTTLARTILGILPPGAGLIRGGEIHFKGRDLLQEAPRFVNDAVRGRAITFIPQDPWSSLSPLFRVGAQIMELMKWKSPRRSDAGPPASLGWPALFQGYPSARRRADREAVLDVLRAVQMPEPERALSRLPYEFSGGQRQRLMIAMALLPNPDLIIADEPTTALDVTIQAQILELLNELKSKLGMAVMLITHDMGVIAETAQRVIVMYAAKVAEEAPVGDLFKEPLHPYTQGLLRSIPRIDLAATKRQRLEAIGGTVPTLKGDIPPGCRFAPRCPFVKAVCTEQDPVLKEIKPGHRVACWLY
jgi:peptide/nickel transport system ATP-binding protein